MAYVTAPLQWLPARVAFTNLEYHGGLLGAHPCALVIRPVPFAPLAVAALSTLQLRLVGELLVVDTNLRAQERARDLGHRLVWERRLSPLRPAVSEHHLVAPPDVPGGHGP